MFDGSSLKAKQAYVGDFPVDVETKQSTTSGCGGQAGGQVSTKGDSLLIHEIEGRSRRLHHENDRLLRAHDILSRHPEFEEFIKLQQLLRLLGFFA